MGTWQNAVDVYVALTQFQKNKLINSGLPASKIIVKPNSVPQSAIGYGNGGYSVFVGRLSSEKGLHTLLEAWDHLPCDTKLKIVGEGPQEDLVREAAAKDQRIEWLQHLPISRVYEVIGDASVLIVPSVCYENFPRVIVEAFSKGTPVICSRLGSMAEIVADGSDGLHFAPGDAFDLSQKVSRFFDQPDLRKQMRKAAHRKYFQYLSPDSNHAQLMRIYQNAIAERSVAVPISETV
jgi:glycosyltransferase involved in cell wall biosynthesis